MNGCMGTLCGSHSDGDTVVHVCLTTWIAWFHSHLHFLLLHLHGQAHPLRRKAKQTTLYSRVEHMTKLTPQVVLKKKEAPGASDAKKGQTDGAPGNPYVRTTI